MPTDATCWHCGQPLANRAAKEAGVVITADTWRSSRNTDNVVPYLIITVAVIVATLVVMRVIGRQPQLQLAIGATVPEGWKPVSPADNSFFFNLPEGWILWDGTDVEQVTTLEQHLSENEYLTLGVHPFAAEVDDLEINFLAQEENGDQNQPGPFLVVATSQVLSGLSYQEARQFLTDSEALVRGTRIVDDFDKSNLSIFVDTPLEDETGDSLRCRQQFIIGDEDAMLVAVCSPRNHYASREYQILTILESFQRLSN